MKIHLLYWYRQQSICLVLFQSLQYWLSRWLKQVVKHMHNTKSESQFLILIPHAINKSQSTRSQFKRFTSVILPRLSKSRALSSPPRAPWANSMRSVTLQSVHGWRLTQMAWSLCRRRTKQWEVLLRRQFLSVCSVTKHCKGRLFFQLWSRSVQASLEIAILRFKAQNILSGQVWFSWRT